MDKLQPVMDKSVLRRIAVCQALTVSYGQFAIRGCEYKVRGGFLYPIEQPYLTSDQ